MNILIAPGTNLIAKEVFTSLSGMKYATLFGAGYKLDSPECSDYKSYEFLPSILNPDQLQLLEAIVKKHDINIILFTHDDYIYKYRMINFIAGAKVIKQNAAAIAITSFKSLTYKKFLGLIPVPTNYSAATDNFEEAVFVKPDRGQGGRGSFKLEKGEITKERVEKFNSEDSLVFTEFLPGKEFTIDCFSDADFKVIYVASRERIKISNGKSIETAFVQIPIVSIFAEIIAEKLQIRGQWFFQLKEDVNGSLKLMEIGLRPAGASGINRLRGVNLPILHVYQSLGIDFKIPNYSNNPKIEGGLIHLDFNFDEVYVDYDDTLLIDGKVNKILIDFLAKCVGKTIPVKLITRHSGDLSQQIIGNGLSPILTEIFHLQNFEEKSNYFSRGKKILFIDDSYKERASVKDSFKESVLTLEPNVIDVEFISKCCNLIQ
jgi:carbamoyl-phosphate synthase large subunit